MQRKLPDYLPYLVYTGAFSVPGSHLKRALLRVHKCVQIEHWLLPHVASFSRQAVRKPSRNTP